LLEVARKITGHPIPVEIGSRRPGDPATLIASSEALKRELGWQPRHSELEKIVGDAWEWFRRHPEGYNS
jgi:UDP-glucose 4-epimerase